MYKIEEGAYKVRLNANENPYDLGYQRKFSLNRYPNESVQILKDAIGKAMNISSSQLMLGNGSSELIELIIKTYLKPGETVMAFEPSFVMYKKYTHVFKGDYVGVKTKDYVLDMDVLKNKVKAVKPKIVFICNPNNPTGSKVSKADLENFLNFYQGILVVDEAYMDFTEGSMSNRIGSYPNLIVLKTFSKAYGLAGARLGYLIAQPRCIERLSKFKSPYNVSQLSLEMGLLVLKNKEKVLANIKKINESKEVLYGELKKLPIKVYPSFANFIAFEGPDALMAYLKSKSILIRNLENNLYRVTVGTQEEIQLFIQEMKLFFKEVTNDQNN